MRLLLAEDERDLANALKAIFEYHQYSVDVVHNGDDALYYAETTEYDSLILDIMMPKKSGLDVLKILRQNGNAVPVLLLTAKNQVEDKVEGLDLGADDYLTKPFETPELLARVRSMLRRPTAFVGSQLEYGELILDRNLNVMRSKDKEVVLNNREFQLMELFLMNRNQVLPTEMIMEKLWGLDSDAEINVVWVNISSLRKKLQQIGNPIKIIVARGIGYKLEVNHD